MGEAIVHWTGAILAAAILPLVLLIGCENSANRYQARQMACQQNGGYWQQDRGRVDSYSGTCLFNWPGTPSP